MTFNLSTISAPNVEGGLLQITNQPLPEEATPPGLEITPNADAGAFTGESEQVAGLAGAIGKAVKQMGQKVGSKATKSAPASGAVPPQPPIAPPPAPMPAAKTIEQIKHGVLQRSIPTADEEAAQRAAQLLTEPGQHAPLEPGRTEWRNFRSDKLQTSDDVIRLIDDVAKQNDGFMDARRGVVSHEQTRVGSQAYGVDELLGRKPGEAWNAAQLTAGRDVMLELGSRIERAASKVAGANATPEDMLAFRQMLAQHAAVQQTMQGAVAEAGRALNILRTVSAPGGRIRSRQVLEALDTLGGEDSTRKLAEMVLDAGGDPLKLAKLARKGWAARTSDAITEVWINGLLSGPQTHIVNTASNSLTSLMQVPERALAGAGRMIVGGEGVELGESAAQLYGMLAGWRDGIRSFAKTMKTGDPSDPMAKLEMRERRAVTASNLGLDPESPTGKALDLFGEYYVRMPGRALMAEDELFKSIGYRQELHAQAYRQAVKEGARGTVLDRRVAELVNDPTEAMHLVAEKHARYVTFSDDLRGENWLESLGQAGQKIANLPLGRFVLPFVRTPTRIAEYTLERTPMALTLRNVRDDIAAGGARRDLAIARMTLGSTVAALVAAETASGRITGGGPADRRIREEMRATGWQPYSIRAGDKYVSYNRLDPMGALIGSAADAVEIMQMAEVGEPTEHVAAAVSMGFANAMMNKTYLQGLSELMDVIGDPDNEKKLSGYAAGQAASFTPSWVNFLRKVDDDALREPVRSDDPLAMTIQMFKNRTPGLSDEVPGKLDIWGEPVRLESGALSPMAVSTAKDDSEAAELVRNRVAIEKPRAVVSVSLGKNASAPVDLNALDKTGFLYADYRQRAGRLAKRYVSELISSPDYASMDDGADGEKALYLRKAFTDARHDALLELIEEQRQQKADDPSFYTLEDAALYALELGKPGNTLNIPGVTAPAR